MMISQNKLFDNVFKGLTLLLVIRLMSKIVLGRVGIKVRYVGNIITKLSYAEPEINQWKNHILKIT